MLRDYLKTIKMKENKTIINLIVLFSIMLIVVGSYFLMTTPSGSKKKYDENTQSDINIGGEFSLTNINGIEENTSIYNGRYRIVYFGFTYCPDICPHALTVISNTIDILDKYNIDIVPIFVTIDPSRDTPTLLKPFLSHFNHKIIGYTGTESQIKSVADQFKVYYAKAPRADAGPNDYLMDHTSFIYFLGTNGKYIKHFPSTSDPKDIATEIHRIVKSPSGY